MSFLNPALLAGALLFSVPLVIHLLNRQRHKRRAWAAMEFLQAAYKKQRSRLRNENLLLLLLRCLLPILLALAIARPLLEASAAALGAGGIVHHVAVVDGSYSMGLQRMGTSSPLQRAQQWVRTLLDGLDPQRARFTLVFAGVRSRFLTQGSMDLAAGRKACNLLDQGEDADADLCDALTQVAQALEQFPREPVQVHVFSDLQQRSLGTSNETGQNAPAADLRDHLRDAVEQLRQRQDTELHWVDCGPFAQTATGGVFDNVQLTALELQTPIAIARTPTTVLARVRNRGQSRASVEVTLDIDGSEPMRKVVQVEPGGETEADFVTTFREIGWHRLRAVLQSDALTADDERFMAVAVRDQVTVLLVDGASEGDPLAAYQYLFESILDPDPDNLRLFAVQQADTLQFLSGSVDPRHFDVTVLADVERLNQTTTAKLHAALAAGKGLLVMLGERADVASYNLHLHNAGEGIQPMRLSLPLGAEPGSAQPRHSTMQHSEHPAFAEFDEPVYREVFAAIPVWRWHGMVPGSLRSEASVLATLTDPEQSPLLIATTHGDGRALFLTSAAASEYRAQRWNRLDDPMVAFALLHGMCKWLALPALDPFHCAVGSELACAVDGRPSNLQVQRPERDGGASLPLGGDAQVLPNGRYMLPPVRDVLHAGFYVVSMQLDRAQGSEPHQATFAVNVNPEEGDLRYADHAQAQLALGLPRIATDLAANQTRSDQPAGSDWGLALLLATLLFLLGEAALAQHVSKRRG